MTDDTMDDRTKWLGAQIDQAVSNLDMFSADRAVPSLEPTRVRDLRRSGGPRVPDNLGTVSLVEQDGILRWVDGFGFRQRTDGRRRRAAPRTGKIVKQLKFARLDLNTVGGALQRLDDTLNSTRGIRSWTKLDVSRKDEPKARGRILLLVHGTFSKAESLTEDLAATKEGRAFFAKARQKYDQILTFDHATVSVAPVLNAVDLSRHLAGSEATVDIVCHSRGGLVARWWVEALNHDPRRVGKVIFVGSPLGGTSLASPARLRAGLDLLTNVADVLGRGARVVAGVAPLFVAVAGLLKVFGSATRLVANTPLLDATVSMVPGLVAQSRTGDNSQILKLREGIGGLPAQPYFAIASDFEPTTPGWAFWRYFQRPRIADLGADIVFDDANDLVVDTKSMTQLSDDLDIPPRHVMPVLPSRDVVHHLNYFTQPEVIAFIERTLEV